MVETAIAELERRHEDALANALRKLHRKELELDRRYHALRKSLAIAVSIITLGCAVGIYIAWNAGTDANEALASFKQETKERRSDTCLIQEREYKANADQLKQTYGYLERLSPEEAGSNLNQTILRQLPLTETRLRTNPAPPFCNEPGVGLSETKKNNPKLPKRKDFSKLLVKR